MRYGPVPCLEFDDDVEGTQAALDMSDRAKKAGAAFFIGCGASPGMNNILAVDAARGLDRVTSIELFWLFSNRSFGAARAVMEHLMHIASGPGLTWVNGKLALTESYPETKYAPIIGSGEIMLHETAHPEPVALPRLYPNVDSIRCYGGLYPLTKFGCARGLGNAVRKRVLPISEAGYKAIERPSSTEFSSFAQIVCVTGWAGEWLMTMWDEIKRLGRTHT